MKCTFISDMTIDTLIAVAGLIVAIVSLIVALLIKRDTKRLAEAQRIDILNKELSDAKNKFSTVLTKMLQEIRRSNDMITANKIFNTNETTNLIAKESFVAVLKRTKGEAVSDFEIIWNKKYNTKNNKKSKTTAKKNLKEIIDYVNDQFDLTS